MPQGKFKVKLSLPESVKRKSGRATKGKNKSAITKAKTKKVDLVNKQITKNVNAALEKQIRQIASDREKVVLSKKKTAGGKKPKK